MKLKVFVVGTVVVLAMAITVVGADIEGKWALERQGAQGTQQTVFNFTVNGDVLTGTVSGGRNGEAKIIEGKIEGNDFSFTTVNTTEVRTQYRGKISGDEIRFTVERQGDSGGGRMGAPNGGQNVQRGEQAKQRGGGQSVQQGQAKQRSGGQNVQQGEQAKQRGGGQNVQQGEQQVQRGGQRELTAKRIR